MLKTTVEQVTATSPAEVIAAVSDLSSLPDWMSRVESAERSAAGRVMVGEQIRRRADRAAVDQFGFRAVGAPFAFVVQVRAEASEAARASPIRARSLPRDA